MSRTKMAEAIASGNVRVNWKTITQSSYNVKAGDLISLRGKGRVEVGEINMTKKNAIALISPVLFRLCL